MHSHVVSNPPKWLYALLELIARQAQDQFPRFSLTRPALFLEDLQHGNPGAVQNFSISGVTPSTDDNGIF